VGTAGVTVEDLKVDGVNVDGLPGGANYVVGISYGETAGTIDDVTVVNMNSVPIATRTYGMWLDAVSTSVSVEVENSRISYYNKNGITARGAQLTVDIHDNTIVGPGTIGPDQVPNGIVLAFETGGTVSYNTVSNNKYSGTTWLSCGIMGYAAKDGVIIEYNEVYDNDIGIGPSSYSTVRGNEVYDCSQGIELEWAAECAYNVIEYNQIHDNYYGIHLLGPGSPYYTGSGDEPGPGNTAHYNNLYGNTEGVRNWDSSQIFDARFNWWGDASGPTHSSNPGGTGDAISDYVDYSPWLGATFETTPRTYHVNPTGTIQEAIDEASPGDTVMVHEGTYNEALYINKNISIIGASLPIVQGSGSFTTNYGTREAVIFVENAVVTLWHLDIEGQGLGPGKNYGVIYEESIGTIRGCIISPNTIGDMVGSAIGIWDGSDVSVREMHSQKLWANRSVLL